MKTLILGSGEGTRLRPLTEKTNKAMLKVAGKPILQHIINHLKKYGFRDIVIAVGIKKEQIIDYFKDGSDFDVKIQYSISEELQQTAGEIAKAKKFLEGEDFLLYYGDTLTDINLNILSELHYHKKALITTPVIRGIPAGTSLVKSDKNGKIIEFVEKPIFPEKANIPIFIIDKSILNHPNISFGKDFSSDVVEELVKEGKVFEYDENKRYDFIDYSKLKINPRGNYHYDVGTIKRYEKICDVFEKGEVGIVEVIK